MARKRGGVPEQPRLEVRGDDVVIRIPNRPRLVKAIERLLLQHFTTLVVSDEDGIDEIVDRRGRTEQYRAL